MSGLFASGGQNIGASASASALPMNIQDWFPLGLTGLISLMSKGLSESSQHHNSKASILLAQPSLWSKSYICMWLFGKTIAFTIWTFVRKELSLLLYTLSRFVIALLPRGLPCVARTVMNLSAMWKTWAQSLGWEDPLEKEMEPTPVFLPGESHGQRSLVELQSIGSQKSDTVEHLTLCFYFPKSKCLLILWL